MAGFCGGNKRFKPDWTDPLGPDASGNMGATGARDLRSNIFGNLGTSSYPQSRAAADEAGRVATKLANDPMWATSRKTLSDTAAGNYLKPNPYLQDAINESRAAADTRLRGVTEEARSGLEGQMAATRAGFGRNGVSFGTGATQAQDAGRAAMEASIARGGQSSTAEMNASEAARLAENYARERGLQNQAATAGPSVAMQQAHELAAIPEMYIKPEMLAGQVVSGLGGGASMQPTVAQTAGAGNYMAEVAKLAALAAGSYGTGGAAPAAGAAASQAGGW